MSILDTYTRVSPRRQLMLGVLAIALIAATLAAVYFFALRKPYEVLFSDLRDMDAATIVAELERRKLPYRLEDGGATILVPADLVDTTRLSVMSQDLPLKGMVGFELFNKSDMGLTEFAQKINYQRALQGELARTIMTLDAVDTARVHLSLPEATIFRADRRPAKASVTLTSRTGRTITPATVLGVQRLVAASVPDLDLSNVVVLDERGGVVSPDAREFTEPAPSSPAIQEKKAIESYYAARIRQNLERTLPQHAFTVSTNLALPLEGTTPELDDWSPDSRRFALRVSVSATPDLPPEGQEQARLVVSDATGPMNPADQVLFSPEVPWFPPSSAVTDSPPVSPATAPVAKTMNNEASRFWVVLLIPLFALLGLLAYGLHRRGRRPTQAEIEDRADRLRFLLQEGSSNAAPRL